jgi:hypothetical protein
VAFQYKFQEAIQTNFSQQCIESSSFSTLQKELVQSEKTRRLKRLEGHYKNNVWKKRMDPPADWNKPLPDRLIKEYENTYLYHRAKEMAGDKPEEIHKTLCVLS